MTVITRPDPVCARVGPSSPITRSPDPARPDWIVVARDPTVTRARVRRRISDYRRRGWRRIIARIITSSDTYTEKHARPGEYRASGQKQKYKQLRFHCSSLRDRYFARHLPSAKSLIIHS